MLLASSSQSGAAGVFGQVEPRRQGPGVCVCMCVCGADVGEGERETVCVCVCVCDMRSPWAAVELMRQQTCVSCQCHPEGDVSNHGCLHLSLSLPDHSLTGSHSTCTLYYLLCVFNYPSLHYLIPSLLFSSAPPLKYLHLISCFVSYLPLVCISLSLSLLSPLFEFLSLSSSSPLSILSGGGVLERCSATANCLLQGAKRGGGETCGRRKGLVVDASPGALRDI